MKFLHLADIHLDMPFKLVGAMGEKRRMMQLDILRQVAEYVNKNKIKYIFIAGDLYEHEYIKDGILVCHGLQSDYLILKKHFQDIGIEYSPSMSLDTVELARLFLPTQLSYRLSDLADSLNIYSSDTERSV